VEKSLKMLINNAICRQMILNDVMQLTPSNTGHKQSCQQDHWQQKDGLSGNSALDLLSSLCDLKALAFVRERGYFQK